MNTIFGLDVFINNFPSELVSKKIGLLCHAPSITSSLDHIVDVIIAENKCKIGAIFGPQHGLFGQTQDNMIEWDGYSHPTYGIPIYSLYGKIRKPSAKMLEGLDAFVIDLQDIGARPYTYVWTLKNCLEVCNEIDLPVWILDRPNPIGKIPFDGPMLNPDYFSFVGGAQIPLSHRMTMGELANFISQQYFPNIDLNIVWMKNWYRNSIWTDTGLPWVIPSPNMPTVDTAIVYPGMVLLEATNVSEGRGTTRPFELFGAPYMNVKEVLNYLNSQNLKGVIFREHSFIPTFQKWQGEWCNGIQIHITNTEKFEPVLTSTAILNGIVKTSENNFRFNAPPYEYEYVKLPFDILSGDTSLRTAITENKNIKILREKWDINRKEFLNIFREIAYYSENP